jgi:hypothetical protein
MRIATAMGAMFLLVGCTMPATSVRSVDSRPSISLSGASEDAELYVDGIPIGKASDYAEPNRMLLDSGTHTIAIVESGVKSFEQTVFIDSEHKNISVK